MMARREPDPMRRNTRAQAAILEATRNLIGSIGYDRMSIEGIAAAAGVGKQTIYRWWPSKAAGRLGRVGTRGARTPHLPNTGDLAADLKTELKSASDLSNDPGFGPVVPSSGR
jgi:AcrR family transcriptional regulator